MGIIKTDKHHHGLHVYYRTVDFVIPVTLRYLDGIPRWAYSQGHGLDPFLSVYAYGPKDRTSTEDKNISQKDIPMNIPIKVESNLDTGLGGLLINTPLILVMRCVD